MEANFKDSCTMVKSWQLVVAPCAALATGNRNFGYASTSLSLQFFICLKYTEFQVFQHEALACISFTSWFQKAKRNSDGSCSSLVWWVFGPDLCHLHTPVKSVPSGTSPPHTCFTVAFMFVAERMLPQKHRQVEKYTNTWWFVFTAQLNQVKRRHVARFRSLCSLPQWSVCPAGCKTCSFSQWRLLYGAFLNYHSFWEEDGQEQENLVNRNPVENNDYVNALKKSSLCVCVCVSLFLCWPRQRT